MAEETKSNLAQTIKEWPRARKLSLLGVAVVSLAIFAVIISQARYADYGLLFANLSNEDAAAVVGWLKDGKVPYRLENGGRAIHVPVDKVHETRLQLTGAGLPQGGGIGFEVFDKQSFGMTNFAQKVNYQRALQGELARTITSLAPVEGARVHLALAEKRLFQDQQRESSASVILKLAPGRQLKEPQVQGIVHLVAGSIDGLEPQNVTVVDASGRVLSQPSSDDLAGPLTPGMLDYQQTLERRLESRAQSLLDRAMGAGNSLVRVTASLDFLQQEQTEELYDPEATVVRSEQLSKEQNGAESVGGVPGVAANLQGAVASPGSSASSRSEETINYEVSKVVSRKVFPVGTLKQLSVAVLVADRQLPGGEGQPSYQPRSAEELSNIENMVRSALGLDAQRGDQIQVSSMPFENIFDQEPVVEADPVTQLYSYLPFVKYGLLLLGGALFYFLLARPMLRTLRSETRVVTPMKTVEELEAELAGQQALPDASKDPTQRLRDQALTDEAPFAQIIKTWLKEG